MKFTSRDLSLKRTPSKKQSGVFGVKINVVTKCVHTRCHHLLRAQQPQNMKDGVTHWCCWETNATSRYICRRERSKVPYIVRQCIEEVEKRGIDEVGIYRISGVATDIQALKSVFDTSKNPLVASRQKTHCYGNCLTAVQLLPISKLQLDSGAVGRAGCPMTEWLVVQISLLVFCCVLWQDTEP